MPLTETQQKLKEKYGNESVLVIPSEDLADIHLPEGFINPSVMLHDCITDKSGFMLRYLAEYNTEFRQPIPYIIVQHKDKYFATRRLIGSGESRLHGKISLGVGGHINPEDCTSGFGVVLNALKRELNEELDIGNDARYYLKHEGYINDNSNEVSRDHIAVVFTANFDSDDVTVKEIDKLEGRFYTMEELRDNYDILESWSQLVLDELIAAQ